MTTRTIIGAFAAGAVIGRSPLALLRSEGLLLLSHP
jgi:hypothetical protein